MYPFLSVTRLTVCPFYSPHPVKPLTPEEKRRAELSEGRSVLDKLKSSIHPGRSSQPTEQQPEKKKVQQ